MGETVERMKDPWNGQLSSPIIPIKGHLYHKHLTPTPEFLSARASTASTEDCTHLYFEEQLKHLRQWGIPDDFRNSTGHSLCRPLSNSRSLLPFLIDRPLENKKVSTHAGLTRSINALLMNIREIVDTHPHGYQERFNRYSRGNGNRTRESGSFSSDSTASNEEKPSITIPIGFSPRTASNSGSEVRRSKTVPDTLGKYLKDDDQDSKRRLIANIAVRGQGVDVSDMDSVFNCIKRQVDVTTVDMNRSQYMVKRDMKNDQFLDWLKQPRPQWSTVRWININGMSWDVIKAIAIEYDLHHLAVEDLLHVPQRTKVDMYPKQTYISCTLLTLMETVEDGQLRQVDPFDSPHGINPDMLSQRLPLDKLDSYKHYHYTERQSYERLQVQMEQVAIFLLQDGTVITLFQVSGQSVADPIIERLAHDYSLTRKHSDASFLLQSIIDGIVDHAIPITDAFRHEINDLETHVLAMPRMAFTRDLHRMTAQLSMLKRTLVPTQMLVHSLRGKDERSPLSSLARIYMGDVMDHCSTMVEDIDSMLNLCEKLINMIFNLIAYDTNASMRKLALVSIIFLPITFVAGVYGTNFKDFPELEHNVGYFWIICGVVIAVFFFAIIGEWAHSELKAASVERQLKRREPLSIGSGRRGRAGRFWGMC